MSEPNKEQSRIKCAFEECDNTFIPINEKSRQKYCSTDCRKKAYKASEMEREARERIERLLGKGKPINEKFLKRA